MVHGNEGSDNSDTDDRGRLSDDGYVCFFYQFSHSGFLCTLNRYVYKSLVQCFSLCRSKIEPVLINIIFEKINTKAQNNFMSLR